MNHVTWVFARKMLALLSTLTVVGIAAAQDSAELPDAASLLDRSVEVTGGRDAFERLQTFIAKGSVEIVGAGISGTMSVFLEGENYYVAIEFPGVGTTESGVTNGIAWEHSPMLGARIKTGPEESQAKRDAAMFIGATAAWREWFAQVETVGRTDIEGEDAYEITMTPLDGAPMSMYFGVESGLALRMDQVSSSQMGDIPMQVTFSNYAEFGGVLTPMLRATSFSGQTVRQILASVEVNAEVPEGRFDLPAAVAELIE